MFEVYYCEIDIKLIFGVCLWNFIYLKNKYVGFLI